MALVGWQAAAAFVLLEVVLRLMHPFSHAVRDVVERPRDRVEHALVGSVPELLARSALGYQPGARVGGFVTNSRGFRTPEYAAEKAPGTWRMLALGDSFTFASGGVPHSLLWPTLVGAAAQARGGRPVEVINLGVPAVGPSYSRRLFQLEGSRLRPDLVLFGFFVGNDFTDEQWAADDGALERLLTRSYAARALMGLLGERGDGPPRYAPRPPPPPLPPGVEPGFEVPGYAAGFAGRPPPSTREELLEIEGHALALCARGDELRFERLLARAVSVLTDLHDEVRAAGGRLCVVVIPDRYQVHPEDLADITARLHRRPEDYDVERPQQGLLPALDRAGIASVDLLPAFRAAAATTQLYNRGDTHWSVEGNALAAGEIVAALGALLSPPEADGTQARRDAGPAR